MFKQVFTAQLVTSIFRYGAVIGLVLFTIIGTGYAGGQDSHAIVGEVVKAVGPILAGALGFGAYDGIRAKNGTVVSADVGATKPQ